jgi:lipoyl(octanoyl) transferase
VESREPLTDARGWRLLVTEPCDGASNMAIDEALWRGRQAGASPPTLRFYGWAPPTVSLGYGQRLDRDVDVEACRRLGIGIVRRPTGGSAIYHDGPERELTYSVVATAEDLGVGADLLETYRWIGEGLLAGLSSLGVPVAMVPVQPSDPAAMPAFCFARTGSFELEVDGRKLVGSAQRRQGAAFLQHGAIMLGAVPARLRRVFPGDGDPLAGMTTLETVLGRRPSFDEAAGALAEGFRAAHGLTLEPGGLSEEEVELAGTLEREKYATDPWTRAGRAPRALTLLEPLTLPSPQRGEDRG